MQIDYYFNGLCFRDMGVYVSKSIGILGLPPRKKINIFEFPGESGAIPDLKNIKYEQRTIKLSCFIKSNNPIGLYVDFNSFTSNLVNVNSTKELKIIISGTTLSFQVYTSNISDLIKTFTNGTNVGTFELEFIEPDTSIYEPNL